MLGTIIAGSYTGTYYKSGDSLRSLGMTQEGFRLRWQHNTDDVDATDTYGQGTVIEQFYQGINMWVGAVFKEYNQGVLYAAAPYQTAWAPTGVSQFLLGTIARAATNVGGPFVLTATSGTPSASSPATLTAAMAIQDKGNPVEHLYGPTHRMTSVMLRIIPVSNGGINYFSTT